MIMRLPVVFTRIEWIADRILLFECYHIALLIELSTMRVVVALEKLSYVLYITHCKLLQHTLYNIIIYSDNPYCEVVKTTGG